MSTKYFVSNLDFFLLTCIGGGGMDTGYGRVRSSVLVIIHEKSGPSIV